MTVTTGTVLKTYFETGDVPTQTQFEDLIDSAVREALATIANTIEDDGFTGILNILSTTSVTSVPTGTYGLRVLGTQATATIAEQVRAELGIQALVTGTTESVFSINTAGNPVFRTLGPKSLQFPGQARGQIIAISSAEGWVGVTASSQFYTALFSMNTGSVPSFEPIVSSLEIQVSNNTSVTVSSIPNWTNQISIMLNSLVCSAANAFGLYLGTSDGVVSAGYTGFDIDVGVLNVALSDRFLLCRDLPAQTTVDGFVHLERSVNSTSWNLKSDFIDGVSSIDICVGHVDLATAVSPFIVIRPSTGGIKRGTIILNYRR